MSENPYDRPSDPAKRHSAALTDGPDRAPARAMLKGTGFTDEDLESALRQARRCDCQQHGHHDRRARHAARGHWQPAAGGR